MVCDFGHVKREVRQLLDEYIDHRLLVPGLAPNIEIEEQGDDLRIVWHLDNSTHSNSDKRIEHQSPRQCVTIIDAVTIDADSVAHWCEQQLRKRLPDTIDRIEVGFSAEKIDGAYYHYSHGLKKHDGKCQRIAHGHRSKIEIWENQSRSNNLEVHWAEKLKDGYIATAEDQITSKIADHLCFEYRAREGYFRLLLPESQVTLIETDSTVENIAQFIANQIQQQHPNGSYLVKAYEGLNKGAMVGIKG